MRQPTTLGEKILRLRKELGMSQQQLAGNEMSRSFLSLVERNLCRPSQPLLEVIAERLGKPVEFFLETGTLSVSLETAIHLVQHAETSLQRDDMDTAKGHAEMALKLCNFLDEPDLTARAHWVLGTIRRCENDHAGAMIEMELYVACCDQAKNKTGMCKGYAELAYSALGLEDFQAAERHARRVVALSQGMKSLHRELCLGHSYLALTLVRLGRLEEAARSYAVALGEIDKGTESRFWANTAMSLGCLYSRLDRMEEALTLTRKAHEVLVKLNHPDRVLAEHNLAIFKRRTGQVQEALVELEACRAFYRLSGQTVQESSVTEDIALCYLELNELARARNEIEQAVKLLDFEDNARLRGRLYVAYAEIVKQEGEVGHARQLLEIALATFRRLRAKDDLAYALEVQQKLGLAAG